MKITFVVFTSSERVFVTTKEMEKALVKRLRRWHYNMKYFDRKEIVSDCVEIEFGKMVVS